MTAAIGRPIAKPEILNQRVHSESIPIYFRQFEGISEIFEQSIKDRNVPILPSMTIFADAARVRVCFNDRNNKRSLFRTADTPLEAIEAINTALITGNTDWRAPKPRR